MEKVYRNNPVGVCSWHFSVSRVEGERNTREKHHLLFLSFYSRLFKLKHAKKEIPPRGAFLSIKVSTRNNKETWRSRVNTQKKLYN